MFEIEVESLGANSVIGDSVVLIAPAEGASQ
jgi:hypothetical protein